MNNDKIPFFSVVIPTYERPDDLKKCLESLSKENQTTKISYEIIVSDDSKTNKCQLLIDTHFPHVSWGKGKQNGPAGNRNAGVTRTRGNWIVFLDDDCIATSRYLESYLDAIMKFKDISVFEGMIFPNRPQKTWAEGCPANDSGGMLWTSNLCVRKSLFIKMKGLDERFKVAFEDVDFAYRLKINNIASKFIKQASVCHPWRSLRKNIKNWKTKGYEWESLSLFLKKHPDSYHEYGNTKIYLKHAFRMITSDLYKCLFKMKGRGIDILAFQFICTISTIIKLKFGLEKK